MKYKYFSYCPEDGFDTHETLEDALLNANGIIPNYLDEGWSEDVTGVFVGTITHAATMCDKVERAGEVDEHGYDEDGEHWDQGWEYKCNYKMLPVDNRELEEEEEGSECQGCGDWVGADGECFACFAAKLTREELIEHQEWPKISDEEHYINCLRTAKSLGYDTVHGALQAISKMKAEPTKAMCIAGCNVAIKDLQSEADWIGDIYRAMVAEREGGGYTSRNESFAFRADGEANFYTVSERGGNWTARIQFNGEFMCDEQERMTAVITDALSAYRTQDDEIPMHSCVMQLDKVGDV